MTIDLSSYSAIQTSLFCELIVPDYDTFYFSDYFRPITFDGVTYTGIGRLLSVTESYSELKVNRECC